MISFLYERGWRQSFSIWGGFPGPEKEVICKFSYLYISSLAGSFKNTAVLNFNYSLFYGFHVKLIQILKEIADLSNSGESMVNRFLVYEGFLDILWKLIQPIQYVLYLKWKSVSRVASLKPGMLSHHAFCG